MTGTRSDGRESPGKPLRLKRVYEPPEPGDGRRILVDRLWPRGLSKAKAAIDLWPGDIGPSDELRKWFGHDPLKWTEFRKRYLRELAGKKELVDLVLDEARQGTVTLLFGAADVDHNNAVALKAYLERRRR